MLLGVLHGNIHIRIDVGCQWEHGYSNRCSVSKMRTWLSKSMFVLFPQNGTWFDKSMLDFQHWNKICQVDVGFPKWEHGFPNRCWMSIHTLGSNNGFKQWVQTWCDAQVWYDINLLNDTFPLCPPLPRLPSSPPFLFPVVCPPLGNSIAGPLQNTAVKHLS